MVDREEVINLIDNLASEANFYEVIAEAFIALKENPNLTIEEAINIGIAEWEK